MNAHDDTNETPFDFDEWFACDIDDTYALIWNQEPRGIE